MPEAPLTLAQGKVETWACAVVHCLGTVNFLLDKSEEPHLTAGQFAEWFGVGKSTGSAKARIISKALGIGLFDPRWSLPSKLRDNPLAWMITVNGLIVDARQAPREIREEAARRGLIPYLP